MAIAPHQKPPASVPDPVSQEQALLANISLVEAAVDAWLHHKDRTQAQAVPLPKSPALDVAAQAELVRRYLAAGWSAASVEGASLLLTPAE